MPIDNTVVNKLELRKLFPEIFLVEPVPLKGKNVRADAFRASVELRVLRQPVCAVHLDGD